jgi:YD repeat-containing protein
LLNRVTAKTVPASATGAPGYTVYYGYDVRGLQTYAVFGSGQGVTSAYDGFGRLTSSTSTMGGASRTLSYQYDAASNRTRVTHPDGTFFTYEYDAAAAPTAVRENGGTLLASFGYDPAGRRSSLGFAGARHQLRLRCGQPTGQPRPRSRGHECRPELHVWL